MGRNKAVKMCIQKLMRRVKEAGVLNDGDNLFEELRKLCESPNGCRNVFHELLAELKKPHSEIRQTALTVIVRLFDLEKNFRPYIVDHVKEVLLLVIESPSSKPLPPPRNVATRLSQDGCQALQRWRQQYSGDYLEFELIFKYLQNVLNVSFENSTSIPETSEDDRRRAKVKELQLKKAREEFAVKIGEIDQNLQEFWGCLELLLPCPENYDVPLGIEIGGSLPQVISEGLSESLMREEGYHRTVSVSVSQKRFAEVTENDDNSAVLENLKNCFNVCTKNHLPSIIVLLEKLSKLGGSDAEIKRGIDVKSKITNATKLYGDISIKWRDKVKLSCNSVESDDNDEWIDVPSDNLATSKGFANPPLSNKEQEICKTVKKAVTKDVIPTLLLSEIPPDDYSADHSFARLHSKDDNIWCNSSSFDPDALQGKSGASSMLTEAMCTRTFVYIGKDNNKASEAPICGAPMPNGKLCPRRDKVKCPFHGPIGLTKCRKLNPKDKPSTSKDSWQDESLARDISAVIGIDLSAPTKGRKRKPVYTELKPQTSRTKLARKLSKRAERVATELNRQDRKRNDDKFSHSFSYSLSRTL